MTNPIDNDQASIALNEFVVESGTYPYGGGGGVPIGFIRTFASLYPYPDNVQSAQQLAQGEVLPINQDSALTAVIDNIYGGNGVTNIALPNLAGRVAVGTGFGASSSVSLAQSYGQDSVTLTQANMPVSAGGGGQAFNNDQPSLGINYMINVDGVYDNGFSDNALGMVLPFLGTGTPTGYLPADGQILNIKDYPALFAAIGTTYGGNGQTTFALPNLQDRAIVGAGLAADGTYSSLGETLGSDSTSITSSNLPKGGDAPINDQQPSLALNYIICTSGVFPEPDAPLQSNYAYLGEIMAYAGLIIPDGWTLAEGQSLLIAQNEPLFSVIGTTYGGNGVTSFNLPNLSGRVVVGTGIGPTGNDLTTGETFGANSVQLNASELPPGTPCYCRGTLIETRCGPERVENLKTGDKVRTAAGALRPIKWIGRRSYAGRFVLGRKDILPVCIKAGALADNVPARDLWISPNHAIYLSRVLIEAKDLINGVSIVQADQVESVEYFHVELDTHDVIIAEGALAESFIDDDSRAMFHNACDYARLYGQEHAAPAHYCAPRLDEGYEVEAARERLAERAGLLRSADAPQLGSLRGYIDRIRAGSIAGWAQNTDAPEAPVCLDIFAAGKLIGRVLANSYRGDLDHAGLGSGRHGFQFTPAAALDFIPDTIEVRRSLDGAALSRSATAKGACRLSAA